MALKIYLADNRPITGRALEVLEKAGDIIRAEDTGENDFIRDIESINPEIMIVGARKTTRNVISSAKNLKAIIIYGVSYDFVDVNAANEHGVVIVNTPGVNAISVAEFALGLAFSILKSIPQSSVATKNGKWTNMTTFRFSFPAIELYGKTVGLVGLGNIGTYLAKTLTGLGAKVVCHTKHPSSARADQHKVEFLDLNTLMTRSDVVIVCCALTDETKGMISGERIGLMKPTSFLVNVSRGAVVDEEALISALREKRISGAALDVLLTEPNATSPFFQLENAIVTPHIAGRTNEAGERLEMTIAEEALRIAQGQMPKTIANKEALDKIKR